MFDHYSALFTSGLLNPPAIRHRTSSLPTSVSSYPFSPDHATSPNKLSRKLTRQSPHKEHLPFCSFLSLDLAESFTTSGMKTLDTDMFTLRSLRTELLSLSDDEDEDDEHTGARRATPRVLSFPIPVQTPIRRVSKESLRSIPSPKPAPKSQLPALPTPLPSPKPSTSLLPTPQSQSSSSTSRQRSLSPMRFASPTDARRVTTSPVSATAPSTSRPPSKALPSPPASPKTLKSLARTISVSSTHRRHERSRALEALEGKRPDDTSGSSQSNFMVLWDDEEDAENMSLVRIDEDENVVDPTLQAQRQRSTQSRPRSSSRLQVPKSALSTRQSRGISLAIPSSTTSSHTSTRSSKRRKTSSASIHSEIVFASPTSTSTSHPYVNSRQSLRVPDATQLHWLEAFFTSSFANSSSPNPPTAITTTPTTMTTTAPTVTASNSNKQQRFSSRPSISSDFTNFIDLRSDDLTELDLDALSISVSSPIAPSPVVRFSQATTTTKSTTTTGSGVSVSPARRSSASVGATMMMPKRRSVSSRMSFSLSSGGGVKDGWRSIFELTSTA